MSPPRYLAALLLGAIAVAEFSFRLDSAGGPDD